MKDAFVVASSALLLVFVGGLFGLFVLKQVVVQVSPVVGATPGPEHFEPQIFWDETTFKGNNCVSGTWNPGAVGSTTVDSVDVTMPSTYAIGNPLYVGFATGTQGLGLGIVASGTVANVYLFDPDNTGAAVNLGTSTYYACYFGAAE